MYESQNFQPPSGYQQREPSPTDTNKYLGRDGNQGNSFRDSKFAGDVNATPSGTQGAHATQGSFPYSAPIYSYPYIHSQYTGYQNPQHSQYPYPRYYRAPFPNYSNTPGYPAPTTSSNTVYTEEMVQAEYKNMFPTMPSAFFHSDANMTNLMSGKNPSSNQPPGSSPPSKGQPQQSFSPPPATSASGVSDNYKTQVAYQNPIPPRDTSGSYYNMMQHHYNSSQTSTAFPYMIQPQQYPRGGGAAQQQYMQN